VLSSGQAANLAGISKREFIETVGQFGVSVFGECDKDVLLNGCDRRIIKNKKKKKFSNLWREIGSGNSRNYQLYLVAVTLRNWR